MGAFPSGGLVGACNGTRVGRNLAVGSTVGTGTGVTVGVGPTVGSIVASAAGAKVNAGSGARVGSGSGSPPKQATANKEKKMANASDFMTICSKQ